MKTLKVWFVLAVLSVVVLFSGCLGSTDNTAGTTTVTGRVLFTNADSSEGITVAIEKSDGLKTTSVASVLQSDSRVALIDGTYGITQTDAAGNYSFEGVEEGLYTIYASSRNSAEKAVRTNITVTADQQTVSVNDLSLTPVGNISGTILVDNTSAGNVGIEVYIPGTSYAAKTADDGSFTIYDVPAGSYGLAINKGYYDYIWKTDGVKVTAGTTFDAGTLTSITTADIEFGYKDGTNGKDGTDGKDGVSINWRGAFTSSSKIEKPSYLDAYYNTTDGCSYIYNGTAWVLLAKAGEDGAENSGSSGSSDGNNVMHITAKATDRGISFSGAIPANSYYKEFFGYYDNTYTYISSNSTIKCAIQITENSSGIHMNKDISASEQWNTWELFYPFVEADKEYSFTVTCTWGNYTFYTENFTVTATAGLGEYVVTNKDSITTTLTSDRVIQRSVFPEFTDNPDVKIEDIGVRYYICRYNGKNFDTGYIYDFYNWSPLENNTLPLKDAAYYSGGWRTYDFIDKSLSGKKYGVATETVIKVAGYSDNETIIFYMNDWTQETGDWGGDVVKSLIVYGAKLDGSVMLYDTELTSEWTEDGHTYVQGLVGMPGNEVTVSLDSGEEVTYPYAEFADFNVTKYTPVELPAVECTVDGKDYFETNNLTNPYKFNGWSVTFPLDVTDTTNTAIVDGKEYYVIYVYANFKEVSSYIVKYYMNDGTDNIFKTQYVYSESNAAGYWYSGALYLTVPTEKPVREGYTFRYWYSDACGAVYDSINLQGYSDNTLNLYALWGKNVTITYMMNDGTTDTAGTAVICSNNFVSSGIENPVRTGYVFAGWYLDADCTESASTVDEDTTVYAKWEE